MARAAGPPAASPRREEGARSCVDQTRTAASVTRNRPPASIGNSAALKPRRARSCGRLVQDHVQKLMRAIAELTCVA